MKVLILGPYFETILFGLGMVGDEGVPFNGPPDEWPKDDFDHVISFGYRHIIKEPLLTQYKLRLLNIHTGYLPFNRGAHPNFWSFHDDTKKGVTLHYMTDQLDHGPIAARVEATKFRPGSTLRSSYMFLHFLAGELFCGAWPVIRDGGFDTLDVDPRDGTSHKAAELPDWVNWDMPVEEVIECGRKARGLSVKRDPLLLEKTIRLQDTRQNGDIK